MNEKIVLFDKSNSIIYKEAAVNNMYAKKSIVFCFSFLERGEE
jgi:hypothetical protein